MFCIITEAIVEETTKNKRHLTLETYCCNNKVSIK